MKKKIITGLVLVCVIVLAYFYAHIDKNTYLYNRNTDTATFWGTGILEKGETLTQTFIARENTIEGINLKVILTGNADAVNLNCVLLDADSKEVAKVSITGAELEHNKVNCLKFPKVTDTKGKQYTLVLSEEKSDEQNGIGFYMEPAVQHEQKLTVAGEKMDCTLVVRTISHRFDIETFVVVLGMVAFMAIFMKFLYKMFK